MRIVVHGQQAFGKAVLEALIKRGENVVAVYVAPEKEGAKADPLKEAAIAAKLPVYQPASYKDAEGLGGIQGAQARPAGDGLRHAVRAGGIPQHPDARLDPVSPVAAAGLSRRRRRSTGRSSRARTKPGCRSSGPTTASIPATCSFRRRRRSPAPTRSAPSISTACSRWASRPCWKSVDLVKAGKAPRIKQDESKATYEGRCGPDNAKIDWGKPWEQIDRLIRGCNPAPGAWTTLDGKQLKIFDAKPLPAKDPKGIAGKLGEIVAVEADGFTVVCADGRFKVTRVQPADGKKIDAGEWAKSATSPSRRGSPELPHAHRPVPAHPNHFHLNGSAPMPASQHQNPKSDIEISQAAKKRPILDIAKEKLGIAPENLEPYGHYKAKVSMDYIKSLQGKPNGKLILVTAITPTPAGEGKTTTTVGLDRRAQPHRQEGDALPARALARAVVRHEGRRRRRRLRPGRADGGHQPALHRRLPRHHLGAQPAVGADRQPHLLGQRARHRLRAASPGGASWT